MMFILVSVTVFIASIIGHMVIHRVVVLLGKKSFKTIAIFVVGLIAHVYIVVFLAPNIATFMLTNYSLWTYPLVMTSTMLYGLLALAYVIYIASPYLGDEGPTNKVLRILRTGSGLTAHEIEQAFTNEELFIKRVGDLQAAGWIKTARKRHRLSSRGRVLASSMSWYRKILKYHKGG